MGTGRTAWGLVRLTRPLNCTLAAAGVVAGMLLAVAPAVPNFGCPKPVICDGPVPGVASLAAPVAALLLTAFGNVLNDLRDVKVDRQAHPGRPLPSGAVGGRAAWRLAVSLLNMGLVAALLAGVWPFVFAVATVVLLFAYEFRLKRRGVSGNVAVALLAASTFAFGAVAQGQPQAAGLAFVAAAMAFFVNLAREVCKDIEDMDADRGARRTLPMAVGTATAGFLAAASAVVGIAASWPFVAEDRSLARHCGSQAPSLALLILGGADLLVLASALLAPTRPSWAQRLLKLGMAFALVAFLGWSVLRGHCSI